MTFNVPWLFFYMWCLGIRSETMLFVVCVYYTKSYFLSFYYSYIYVNPLSTGYTQAFTIYSYVRATFQCVIIAMILCKNNPDCTASIELTWQDNCVINGIQWHDRNVVKCITISVYLLHIYMFYKHSPQIEYMLVEYTFTYQYIVILHGCTL